MLLLAAAALLPSAFAPIPPCSPLRYINSAVESDEAAWLVRDLPGHPVRPCVYDPDWKAAPPEERSLLAFFKQPGAIERELRSEAFFWAELGLPRLNERFWREYDAGTLGQAAKDLKKWLKSTKKELKESKKAYKLAAKFANKRSKRYA